MLIQDKNLEEPTTTHSFPAPAFLRGEDVLAVAVYLPITGVTQRREGFELVGAWLFGV
jgi:hypothetical protein